MVPFVAKILEACSESKVGCLVFVSLFDSPFSTNMAIFHFITRLIIQYNVLW